MRKFRNEAGFNLIEAAIVLGIVGLVVGGIWAAAAAAYENMRQQSASKNLLALAQNIKGYYTNSGSTTVDTSTTNLIRMGVVPKDMISGTTLMQDPWGNTVTVESSATAGTDNFAINFSSVGKSSCKSLISRNASVGSGVILGIAAPGAAVNITNAADYTNPNCGTAGGIVRFIFSVMG